MIDAVLNRFEVQAPVATMVRATMANVLAPKQLDAIFRDAAVRQREGELLFSTVVGLLHLAVLKTKPSLHAAYQAQHEEIGVSIRSVYEKVAQVELPVTRELVRRTASGMGAVLDALAHPSREVLRDTGSGCSMAAIFALPNAGWMCTECSTALLCPAKRWWFSIRNGC